MPAVRRHYQLRRRAGRELRSAPAQVRGRRRPEVDDDINHSSTGDSDDFVVIGNMNTTKGASDGVRPRYLGEEGSQMAILFANSNLSNLAEQRMGRRQRVTITPKGNTYH